MQPISLYPRPEAYHSAYLEVSGEPSHSLYYEEYGHPQCEPVLLMHGGPGVPLTAKELRIFDPQRFRLVSLHQRGAGKSKPFLSMQQNTTWNLLEDIGILRERLGITGKAHIFGGSWGSFLSLIYAIAHPELVGSLTVRGILLGRPAEFHHAYQCNAQIERKDYTGAADFFPDAWQEFVNFIPGRERGDMIAAYYRRIHDPEERFSRDERLAAARQWCKWEDATVSLEPQPSEALEESLRQEEDRVWSTAMLETHYFHHGCFLEDENHILHQAATLATLPITIVQGRYDMATPRKSADALVQAINAERVKAGVAAIAPVITTAGHTMSDPENARALMAAMERAPSLAR